MSDTWFDDAACSGGNPYEWDTSSAYARRICGGCPVATECLTYAMRNEDGYAAGGRGGMYGGLNPDQRGNLARKQPA